MARTSLFHFEDRTHQPRVGALLRRLPHFDGEPIVIQGAPNLASAGKASHAGAFLRERRIVFACTRAEFPRIFVHELFHFVWLRAGNPARLSWERLLRQEFAAGARGELGWSSEWRKLALTPRGPRTRTRQWREYCCEAFCDTAAWLYSGTGRHAEFTLGRRFRAARRNWFLEKLVIRRLPL